MCGKKSVKRFSSKTFDIIELFYHVRDQGHCMEYFPYYNYIRNSIQINKSKIICILRDGNCNLYEIII